MKSCAFFGHGDYDYRSYEKEIKDSIVDLIENYGVTQFYTGGRGAFDAVCSQKIAELKQDYPYIKNTLVLSYMPKEDWKLAEKYDDSVYLLEESVPPKYAISRTNRILVEKADFVITAVERSWGGAQLAHEYAERKQKLFRNILNKE